MDRPLDLDYEGLGSNSYSAMKIIRWLIPVFQPKLPHIIV